MWLLAMLINNTILKVYSEHWSEVLIDNGDIDNDLGKNMNKGLMAMINDNKTKKIIRLGDVTCELWRNDFWWTNFV